MIRLLRACAPRLWPGMCLLAWLAALACSAWIVAAHTKISTDLTGFLPRAPERAQQLLLDQLRAGPASRLLLIGIEGDSPQRLAALSRTLADALRQDPELSFAHNGEVGALETERALLLRYRYLLSPAVAPDHFSPAALQRALQDSAQLLASQGGALAKPLIPSDPTGEVARVFALWTPATHVQMHDGVWFAADAGRALLLAQTRASGLDAERQQAAIGAIQRHFAAARAQQAGSQARLLLSGTGVFAAASRLAIERDSWRLSLVATLLVWLVLWLAYRSLRLTLFAFIPVASGFLVGVAAVALACGGVHGITLAFGATLIGEAVDYPNYAFLHTARGEPLRHALARIGPTLRLAILTTVFSSTALLLSSFAGLAQLGLLSLVGMAVAGLTTQYVLPLLTGGGANSRQMERLPFALLPAPGRHRRLAWALLLPLALAALASLALARGAVWDDDLAGLSPVAPQARQLDQELRRQLGAPDLRYVLLSTGRDREQALRNSEAVQADLARLVQDGVIGGFDMAAHYLPSRATQLRRRDALPDDAQLQRALRQALAGSPFRDDAFQPFLRDVAQAKRQAPLRAEDLPGSSIGLKVQSLLLDDPQGAVALITLADVRDAARLRAAIGQLAAKGISAIDLKDDTGRLISRYRGESLRLSGLGLLLIALLLWISLGNLRAMAQALFPVVAGSVLCAALTVQLGEKLTLFHLVALLLVVGVGLNYALFFNRRATDPSETRRNHLSLAVCSLTTFLSFGTLTLSALPVLHAIGQTVALGSLLCLACAYLLAPRAA